MNVTSGSQAVDIAKQWLGTPYQWGGGHGGPVPVGTPVDCSGLVDQVFGISGNTYTQESMGSAVSGISQAQPGDLIFFGPLAPNEAYHVGIYTGVGMMIDAPHTGTTVRYDTVAQFGSIAAIRRLVPSNSSVGGNGNSGPALFNYAQLEGVWILAGGPQQWAPMAAAIAMAESSGNPNASNTNSNGSTDRGLWQINTVNGSASSFDIMTNARGAISLSNNGTNWRPWCTAYSDGACGTNGGAYEAPGSPYQKFYNPSISPDTSIPINATNAAAVLTSAQQSASLDSSGPQLNGWDCLFGNPYATNCDPVTNAIKNVMSAVLTPLVQLVAGALGVGAGVLMMIYGVYSVITSTQSGQQAARTAKSGARFGAQIVAPESALAGAVRQTYEKTLPSGQTQITTVVGQRRPFGRYRQRTQRDTYGIPTSQRPPTRSNVGTATYSGPGPSARPQGAAPDTKNLLREEASSYPATTTRHSRRGPGGRFYPRGQ